MADIAGSTEITERIGAENWLLLIQDVVDLALEAIRDFSGHPLNFTGDGVFALFGAPVAVEHASLNACRAAQAIQQRMAAGAARFEARYGARPSLRIGIAGGEVLVSGINLGNEVKPTATGSTVNLAARLQMLAPPGGVVCSDLVVEDVGRNATWSPLGGQAVKGFADLQAAYLLRGVAEVGPASAEAGPAPLRLVGRTAALTRGLGWAVDPAAPPLCLIHGAAGIGKTRLASAIVEALAPGRRTLVGRCTPERMALPLAPVTDLLRHWADWRPGDAPEALAARLAQAAGVTTAEVAPLAALVGEVAATADDDDGLAAADAAVVARQQLMAALRQILAAPDAIAVIEDAHWIDPTSEGVLRELLGAPSPGLHLLVTSRTATLAAGLGPAAAMRLALKPLTAANLGEIADQMLPDRRDRDTLVSLVAEKSEGNPFFATEILKHVVARPGAPLDPARIGNLQHLMFARFDLLDPQIKDLLRMAAVLGRSFPLDLVAAAAGVPTASARRLSHATDGLTEPDPDDPATLARFSHVLFRDMILASIPQGRRAGLHHQAGTAIEAAAGDDAVSRAAILADHFENAGEHERALRHLDVAARDTLRLYALEICDAQLARAFRLIDALDGAVDGALYGALLETWARCLDTVGDFARMASILDSRLPALRMAGDSYWLHACLSFSAKAQDHLANYEVSLRQTDEAIAVAEATGDLAGAAIARVIKIRGLSDSGRGTLEEIRALFDQTREVAETSGDLHLLMVRHYHMISAVRSFGRFAESMRLCDELVGFGRSHGINYMIGAASWQQAVLYVNFEDPEATVRAAETCIDSSVHGTNYRRCGIAAQARGRLFGGQPVAVPVFSGFLAEADRMGDVTLGTANASSLALCQLFTGQVHAGMKTLDSIMRRPAHGGAIEIQRSIRLIKAEVLLSLAGLLDTGRPRPRIKPLDALYALTLRLTARRKAEAILDDLLAGLEPHGGRGYYVGRVLCDLALIRRARGDRQGAAEYAERGAALLEAEGAARVAGRYRKALA